MYSLLLLFDQLERLHLEWFNKFVDRSELIQEYYKVQINLIIKHVLEFQQEHLLLK